MSSISEDVSVEAVDSGVIGTETSGEVNAFGHLNLSIVRTDDRYVSAVKYCSILINPGLRTDLCTRSDCDSIVKEGVE